MDSAPCVGGPLIGAFPWNDIRFAAYEKTASRMLSTKVKTVSGNISTSEEKPSDGPRTMPTRHSRHHFPPVAPLSDLQRLTDEILTADPGTLFGACFEGHSKMNLDALSNLT
jgi:hypothetical protein